MLMIAELFKRAFDVFGCAGFLADNMLKDGDGLFDGGAFLFRGLRCGREDVLYWRPVALSEFDRCFEFTAIAVAMLKMLWNLGVQTFCREIVKVAFVAGRAGREKRKPGEKCKAFHRVKSITVREWVKLCFC